MKRGNITRGFVLTGAMVSALALSACQVEDPTQNGGRVFESMDACMTASRTSDTITPELCEEGFAGADAEHERVAPRYNDTATCEEIHGVGNCVARTDSDGGSFLLPLMAGYLIGNALSGSGRPMYNNREDRNSYLINNGSGFSTVARRPGFQSIDQSLRSAPSTAPRFTSTTQARPATGFTSARPAPVARSTGGFGAGRTSGGTSFGG